MTPRARELIRLLDLSPHPEGGFYREAYRASAGPGLRPAGTAIYFLLAAGQASRWHRVDADEAWHFYEGGPLELLWEDRELVRVTLGSVDGERARPLAVVPAGRWQAARPLGDYALVGCTVAPGFDFRGFALLADDPAAAAAFRLRHPDAPSFL